MLPCRPGRRFKRFRLQAIVDSGRRTGTDVEELLETIATASTRGSGARVVLGRFGDTGTYIQEALDTNGVFYDTSGEVYDRLRGMGFDPIDVNESFLRQQDDAGVAFEFSLRGLTNEEAQDEVQAILALAEGDLAGARDSLRLGAGQEFPARIQEASWLLGTGYDPIVDLQDMIIRWQR